MTFTTLDIIFLTVLSLVVVGMYWFFYRELQLLLRRRSSEVAGSTYGYAEERVVFLTGLSIGLIMKIVGALMIDAIKLLPAMAALRIGRSFGQLIVWMSVSGLLTTYGGLLLSLQFVAV
ncbi:high-affinity zinc transporter membrane component [compost metagenome]